MVARSPATPLRSEHTPTPIPDIGEIRRALDVLHPDPTDVIELRALNVRSRQWPTTASGYFIDRDLCAAAAAEISPYADGVYITLNRIHDGLLARAWNRVRGRDDSSVTTADQNVRRHLWLPVDIDPVRPAGISSTDEERQWAFECAEAIREYLWIEGWASPILADSGNGAHLLYKLDLGTEDKGVIEGILTDLSRRFDSQVVKVDTTVFNPARIFKLYGTLARKGDHCPSIYRPHRVTRLLEVPDDGV